MGRIYSTYSGYPVFLSVLKSLGLVVIDCRTRKILKGYDEGTIYEVPEYASTLLLTAHLGIEASLCAQFFEHNQNPVELKNVFGCKRLFLLPMRESPDRIKPILEMVVPYFGPFHWQAERPGYR